MSQRYNLEKIKVLLTEVFTDEELRCFCYDTLEFIPVYKQLRRDTRETHVIHQLVNYANQNSQLETLLNWAKTHNSIAYEKYQPYYDDISVPAPEPVTASSATKPATPNDEFGAAIEKPKFSFPLRIFFCHASEDKTAVYDLYHRLRAEGLDPWLDEEDLLPGQVWQQEIPDAIRASDVILVCLSNNATTKEGYIRDEIAYALDIAEQQPKGTIFFIPVRLEECQVPERLRRWHWVNLFEDTGYDRLIGALQVRAQSLKKGIALKGRLLKAARDPMWQMIGAIIAFLALGWAIYTFYDGGEIPSSTSATATLTPTIVAVASTSKDSSGVKIEGDVENSQIAGGDIFNIEAAEESKNTAVEFARKVSEDPRYIEALNSDGEPIWRYQVDGQIVAFDVFDLDGDGTKELVVGTSARDGQRNTDAGKVIVISQAQERLAEFNLYDDERPTIYHGATSPYYWVSMLKVADLFSGEQPYIVVTGHNAEWFSSRIVILSFGEGGLSLKSNYWHPGFPGRLVIDDLNKDGIMELIISASNNSFPYETGNPIGVFALRSDEVGGQAPPYYGDAPKGTQLWYYLIQPDSVTVTSLGVEDRDGDQFLDVKIGLSDSCFYYINYEGEILAPQIGTKCKLESRLIPLD